MYSCWNLINERIHTQLELLQLRLASQSLTTCETSFVISAAFPELLANEISKSQNPRLHSSPISTILALPSALRYPLTEVPQPPFGLEIPIFVPLREPSSRQPHLGLLPAVFRS